MPTMTASRFRKLHSRGRTYLIPFNPAVTLTLALVLPLAAFALGGKTPPDTSVAVGPQYDTAHVYVASADIDAFVSSLVATFGGKPSKRSVANVLPVDSSTQMQYILTPV